MAKVKAGLRNVLGGYETHFRIGLFFAVLSFLFLIPAAKLSVVWKAFDNAAVANFVWDLSWFVWTVLPVVFCCLSGVVLARNVRKSSRLDALVTALVFTAAYVIALLIPTPADSIYWYGNNWLGTIILVGFFSALGAGIGRYVSSVFK